VHRVNLKTWEQFRRQFLEDFGDQNRAIKAERELANLNQGENETFQQLFLRFTRLTSQVRPVKSTVDQLYILKSALKLNLRAACMSMTTISDLKRMCNEYESIDRMKNIEEVQKVNIVQCENDAEETMEYWNHEAELCQITDDIDKLLVIEEVTNKKKLAMTQDWSKDQKKQWLKEQICWNCDSKGHLQGQCDKKRQQHCVKCGNKKATSVKNCPKCSGNVEPLMQKGTSH
jgi:hypothetical protein